MKRILAAGFEPFGQFCVNPSWEAVRVLPEEIAGARILTCRLPVEYERSWDVLRRRIEETRPDAVVCTGLAAGRDCVTPEKIAVNWRGGAADNAGTAGREGKIRADGADGYFATLDPDALCAAARAAGVPAKVSFSAGVYVCNSVFYCLLHYLKTERSEIRGGFVHVPCLTEQAEQAFPGRAAAPAMSLEDITAGLRAMLEAAARGRA